MEYIKQINTLLELPNPGLFSNVIINLPMWCYQIEPSHCH